MNYPDIDWQDRTLKTGNKYTNLHNNFLDMIDEHHLSQVIKDPTRGENTLDLFLTNNETFVTNNQTLPGISDHSAILVESRIRADKVQQSPAGFPCRTRWRRKTLRPSVNTSGKAGNHYRRNQSRLCWLPLGEVHSQAWGRHKTICPSSKRRQKRPPPMDLQRTETTSQKREKTPCQSETLSLQHKHLKTEGHTAQNPKALS